MFKQRTIVTLVVLPVLFWIIYIGGWPHTLLFTIALGIAGWEYVRMFNAAGYQPNSALVVTGVVSIALGRYLFRDLDVPMAADAWILTAILTLSLIYFLYQYERGDDRAAYNFLLTLGGVIYIGTLGGYLISLRTLPDGEWWTMTVLPGVWLADTGAYLYGRKFGRRKISPRLSPKKTFEGYLAGLVSGAVLLLPFVLLWQTLAGKPIAVNLFNAALIGLAMGSFTIIGDLGISMLKRTVGVKDSGHIIPGHGGFLDRLDSWMFGAALGFWLIYWFFL